MDDTELRAAFDDIRQRLDALAAANPLAGLLGAVTIEGGAGGEGGIGGGGGGAAPFRGIGGAGGDGLVVVNPPPEPPQALLDWLADNHPDLVDVDEDRAAW